MRKVAMKSWNPTEVAVRDFMKYFEGTGADLRTVQQVDYTIGRIRLLLEGDSRILIGFLRKLEGLSDRMPGKSPEIVSEILNNIDLFLLGSKDKNELARSKDQFEKFATFKRYDTLLNMEIVFKELLALQRDGTIDKREMDRKLSIASSKKDIGKVLSAIEGLKRDVGQIG